MAVVWLKVKAKVVLFGFVVVMLPRRTAGIGVLRNCLM